MSKKDIVLLLVIVAFVGASAFLLYSNFNGSAATVLPGNFSNEDAAIKDQVDRIDVRIKKALKRIEEGGELDKLETDPQFQSLNDELIKPIIPGTPGRSNPFLRVER